jgi:hypothetical protein
LQTAFCRGLHLSRFIGFTGPLIMEEYRVKIPNGLLRIFPDLRP